VAIVALKSAALVSGNTLDQMALFSGLWRAVSLGQCALWAPAS